MSHPTISIRNATKRTLTLHVPELGHDEHRMAMNERSLRADVHGWREFEKKTPKAITLLPRGTDGDTVTGLPHSAARSPEVASLKAKRLIEVTEVAPPEPVAAPEQSPEAPEAPKPGAPALDKKVAPSSGAKE